MDVCKYQALVLSWEFRTTKSNVLTPTQQTLCLILLFFFAPETSAANILHRRAARLRKATGDERLRSQSELDMAHHTTKDQLFVLTRAFTLTFMEPIVFVVDLYTALLYGVLFTWFESFPMVFGDIYGFDVQMQGLVYLGLLVAMLIVVPLYLLWVKLVLLPSTAKPTFRPEYALPPTWAGALALPICLFWYGWSARASIHWIVPIIGASLFTIPLVTFFNSASNYLGMLYPHYAASVFAGNTLFRAVFGAIFPLFVSFPHSDNFNASLKSFLVLQFHCIQVENSLFNRHGRCSTNLALAQEIRFLEALRHSSFPSLSSFTLYVNHLLKIYKDLELIRLLVRSQDQRNEQACTA